jgi:hypothetical protein
LNRKGIVDRKTLKEMTEMLAEREAAHKAVGESSDDTASGDDDEEEPRKKRRFSEAIIQQRMEEDRERVFGSLRVVPELVLTVYHSIRGFARISGRYRRPNLMLKTPSLKRRGKKLVTSTLMTLRS